MIHHNKSFAFTLAEVLITLGIIGVVAALTLPSLITKYKEKELVTSYLRVYSILENAYRRVQGEYGAFDNWSTYTETESGNRRSVIDAKTLYEYMVKPYIEVNEAFLPKNSNWNNTGKRNCWPEKSKYLDGTPYSSNANGEYMAKSSVSLKSGECIVLGYGFGDFVVDLNSKKGPNVLGKDQFVFSFDNKRKERLKPGNYEEWWTDSAAYCDVNSSNGWIAGISCGFWIVRNHNMDYLHMSYDDLKKRWAGGVW